MSDVLRNAVAFERISVIAKLCHANICNDKDRGIMLSMIEELAENAKNNLLSMENENKISSI
ncbi:hypothetical protein [Providencia sp. PROV079]|uniref:hypothetical protein n=1 Tax=Providencia sp. PROV079 TaxID=2949800 RepID=UPI00234BFEE3|nr:hypothetical protein [Providencia sp. PROV079]